MAHKEQRNHKEKKKPKQDKDKKTAVQSSSSLFAAQPPKGTPSPPPAIYFKLSDPLKQRAGSLELPWGSAPRPVAPPSLLGSNDARALLPTG